jgi:hypothetical protein
MAAVLAEAVVAFAITIGPVTEMLPVPFVTVRIIVVIAPVLFAMITAGAGRLAVPTTEAKLGGIARRMRRGNRHASFTIASQVFYRVYIFIVCESRRTRPLLCHANRRK